MRLNALLYGAVARRPISVPALADRAGLAVKAAAALARNGMVAPRCSTRYPTGTHTDPQRRPT